MNFGSQDPVPKLSDHYGDSISPKEYRELLDSQTPVTVSLLKPIVNAT